MLQIWVVKYMSHCAPILLLEHYLRKIVLEVLLNLLLFRYTEGKHTFYPSKYIYNISFSFITWCVLRAPNSLVDLFSLFIKITLMIKS